MPSAGPDYGFGSAEIDLGFAAAGDAAKKKWLEMVQVLDDRCDSAALIRREGIRCGCVYAPVRALLPCFGRRTRARDPSALDELLQRRARIRRKRTHRAIGEYPLRLEGAEDLAFGSGPYRQLSRNCGNTSGRHRVVLGAAALAADGL